jgi:hypothetical protein
VVGDRDRFALAQTAKLGEEVGELNAEISQFTSDSLAGELANVMVLGSHLFQGFWAAERAGKPELLEAMRYVQSSLTSSLS